MRVISLRQPWATLVSLGAKSRETRSWYTSYRGPIAIHASAGIDARVKKACSLPPVRDVLTGEGYENWRDLPRGVILAVGRITDVQEISLANTPPSPEFDFGNYIPGRFQWFLSDIRLLPSPIPAKGSLGLWRTNLLDDREFQGESSPSCRQLSLLENADSRARKEEWSRLAVTPAGGRPLGTHMRRAPHRPHDRGVDRDAEGLVRALSEPSLRQYRPPTTRGCRPNGLAC